MSEIVLSLPAAAVAVWPLPSAPTLQLPMPVVAVDLLPAGFIPFFDPEAVVVASGSGVASVIPRGVVGAAASGSGAMVAGKATVRTVVSAGGEGVLDVLGYDTAKGIPAAVVSSGSGSTVVQVRATSMVSASSSGDSIVAAAAAALVAADGSGASVVTPRPGTVAAGTGSGTTSTVPGVRTTVNASGAGSTAVTASAGSGMEKSTTQVMSTNSTSSSANVVRGWTVMSKYPNSVIVDDSLVIGQAGTVTVTATATISSSGTTSHSRGIHILLDGAIVATDSTTAGSQTSFSVTVTGPVSAGQRIGLAAWVQATTTGYRNLTAAQVVVTSG